MAIDPVPRGPVQAKLNFYQAPADGSHPINYVDGTPPRNFGDDPQTVSITDVRGSEGSYSLDRDAFQVVQGVGPSAEASFTDDASIRANYYPEVEALLLAQVPGATRVVFFDHTIRRADAKTTHNPMTRVHIDQTVRSVAQRVRRHRPGGAGARRAGRGRGGGGGRPRN